MKLFDLDACPYSGRNGSYGGAAGDKDGVLIDGEPWILKYPRPNLGMDKIERLAPFSLTPLSEYLASHIYGILGFDVHETILGKRNGFLVVACKDFCKGNSRLFEMRTVKNVHIVELNEKYGVELHETGDDFMIDLRELFVHFALNPELKELPGVSRRFWDQVVIDGLLANNDRNNGNWGILANSGGRKLAPIFDNGASFYSKKSEAAIASFLAHSESDRRRDESNVVLPYTLDGKHHLNYRAALRLSSVDIGETQASVLTESIKENAKKVASKMGEIEALFYSFPNVENGIEILSDSRKSYYLESFKVRFEDLLLPSARSRN